ncbi:ATP-binding cassette domain-containing protein [Pseudoalteromonas sp. Scap03]|uniref:AAA family ATPase n=1 Tax=unclassified Pseudoalteromonas TaxID=194690 RepID=UPI0015BF1409|nr:MULTISPECIES: AAA family ATPase [unclassified Pseudoalteromonas]NWL15509.1 ATP-binding cassette domain-containing protein [Pseudoalteromonas sp. Scap03]QLE80656.1 AAA family ATPase [Pseudoalteromonas sp. Scap25]QLE88599.1 AAA family ATPase [Pseudoalteromonas sp. Scap06]
MNFIVLARGMKTPQSGLNTAYLTIDHWNDFSFVTMFYLELYDEKGVLHDLGNVKIGFKGQTTEQSTHTLLGNSFQQLSDGYFSVGQDVDYYRKISSFVEPLRTNLLSALKDIVLSPRLIEVAQEEEVFRTALLRDVSLSVIKGQFPRVLAGQPPLTNFEFKFSRPESDKMSGFELKFKVKIDSKPSTNIHAVIGRNGVGKTTLLNGMIEAITSKGHSTSKFYDVGGWQENPISNDYFSSLVSVSFSAFDPFEPPIEQPDPSQGTCYFYVGLKKEGDTLKSLNDIRQEFLQALKSCFSQTPKRDRWLRAIETLESDENFERMGLKDLSQFSGQELASKALKTIERMSSGHAVVLLTITRLVATVEEKTLVLIDEPESHLHPPLLSAFVRALSELLHDRNGVAIIATHSPVVLQEVPKSSAWKINRVGLATEPRRLNIETFGENVGVLTREVFGLEVVKSGFHDLLVKSVESGSSYQEIVNEYNHQLGLEARSLLMALVTHRDRGID